MLAKELKDLVWVIMDGNNDWKIMQAFEVEKEALRLAGSLVGNMSYSGGGDIRLFGRGDGNTEIMVRQLPRKLVLADDVIIVPKG